MCSAAQQLSISGKELDLVHPNRSHGLPIFTHGCEGLKQLIIVNLSAGANYQQEIRQSTWQEISWLKASNAHDNVHQDHCTAVRGALVDAQVQATHTRKDANGVQPANLADNYLVNGKNGSRIKVWTALITTVSSWSRRASLRVAVKFCFHTRNVNDPGTRACPIFRQSGHPFSGVH